MEISKFMHEWVITCRPETSVVDAGKIMAQNNIGSIVILKNDQPIGIFTERDLLNRVVALGRDPEKTTVGEVMTDYIICVDAKDSVDQVNHLFVTQKIRHAPVMQEGALAGFVSQKDINKSLDESLYAHYYYGMEFSRDY